MSLVAELKHLMIIFLYFICFKELLSLLSLWIEKRFVVSRNYCTPIS
jgi:hypothetical protein